MTPVRRLVTFVDLDEQADDDTISVSARHEVELADGSRALILNYRGWAESGPPNMWAHSSAQDIVSTARMVVGPDEPPTGVSYEQMEADHWAQLAEALRRQELVVDALELKQIPHDVLSERRLARLGHDLNDDPRNVGLG